MKNDLLKTIKLILADRPVLLLILAVILTSLGYCFYVGFSLHYNDLQVAVHYSAYGKTSFYREKWYYLISFVFFGLTIAAIHTGLVLKFYSLEKRQLALAFGFLSLLMVAIATVITHSILKVAFL